MIRQLSFTKPRAVACNSGWLHCFAQTCRLLLLALLLQALLSPLSAHAHLPTGIDVSLQMASKSYSPDDPVLIEVSYQNTTTRTIEMLTWGTALEGRVTEDFLVVTMDGQEIPYAGMHVKRAPPRPADRVLVKPGETVSGTVDLFEAYKVNYKAEYEVRYRFHDVERAVSQTIRFNLKADRPIVLFKPSQTFINCEGRANHAQIINSAIAAAEVLSRVARDDLRSTPIGSRPNATRYTEWFGFYDPNRWNKVQSNFDNIYNAALTANLTFECDETGPYYAYVYPSQPYKIYLGPFFWSAPLTGTDSKAGTLIHEISHFTIIAQTDDHVYGQSGAKSLADNNPNLAVDNADNHEYFAENTPFLQMPELDLELLSASVSAPQLTQLDPGTFNINIRNNGNVVSTATTATAYLSTDAVVNSADQTLGTSIVSGISAGSTTTRSFPFIAPETPGIYYLGACVAVISGELSSSNNCSNPIAIEVLEKPAKIILAPIMLLLDEELDEE